MLGMNQKPKWACLKCGKGEFPCCGARYRVSQEAEFPGDRGCWLEIQITGDVTTVTRSGYLLQQKVKQINNHFRIIS